MPKKLASENATLERQYEALYYAYLDSKEEILRLKKVIKCLKKPKS